MTERETLHVTTVAIGGRAVLLEGASGAGKSDLALRLIDRGAELVSDDYTLLVSDGERLLARAPGTIAGQMEVRGVGIVSLPHRAEAPVAMLFVLDETPARLPEPASRVIAGIAVPVLALDPLPASAPLKVEWALRQHEVAA